MKKLTFLLSGLFLLLALNADAHSGIYLTAESGWADQAGLPSASEAGANSITTNNVPALRLGVGYNHDILPHWGIGLNIAGARYGKATYRYYQYNDTVRIHTEALEFLAVNEFHINDKADLLLKIGGTRQITTANGLFLQGTEQNTNIKPEAAVVAAYSFVPHVAGTMSYLHIFGTKGNNLRDDQGAIDTSPGINAVLLGIAINFF